MDSLKFHCLSDFIDYQGAIIDSPINDWYEGFCPQTQQILRLPRTALAEAIAVGLMKQLAQDSCYSLEGKMYGILLVETPSKQPGVLKAFSGLLNSQSCVTGWVQPISGREKVALQEAETLVKLAEIKQQIINLDTTKEKQEYETLFQEWQTRLDHLTIVHQQRKQQRQKQRQLCLNSLKNDELNNAIEQLNQESRRDKWEKKQLKQQQYQSLKSLQENITTAAIKITQLKQQRKQLSRQLQAQMHAVYSITNFAEKSYSLQDLLPNGLPTGTGDCCAPKLLHYAATHHLKPLAMAEFWWGPSLGDKIPGNFYGPCRERCQPLMGFLLSGLSDTTIPKYSPEIDNNLQIIYEDKWLIAINKPAALLSVPGRYSNNQDSVLSRFKNLLASGENLRAVHRLDQDTSGILLLAKDSKNHHKLTQQFAQRKVFKTYEAILSGSLLINQGIIELPLWGDPSDRPYQKVDFLKGKPSITQFQVIGKRENYSRVELIPVTGRTHQLRVHCADLQGLGMPILGDRLYGNNDNQNRLHLHAREIKFEHPQLQKMIQLKVDTPF
ncbi:RluA family pseudouridine synthase [Crocosphaera sp. XPORK-15E]|uniref:RluA family pseudouridine synthase n=1 Tax=Crocosphaera sp. XPORK-15E TaxID=3110247 RepID=UPI002B1FCE64|nr:RluA family pseudouridine synthase [Crocosphaera sp. XPORK-15E]MEA5536358.1 RluA family pseudouridine synthase [Crocosphaera sp. XPORK-15E]